MSRPNDTERMRPADATDPSALPEPTDPGEAVSRSRPATTQPLPIVVPMTTAPTTPEVRPLVDRRNATDPDIDPLLKAFDRTPVPPAPMPDERASSDGGDFVAHYAVTRPATRDEARAPVPRVVVQRELRRLIEMPSADADPREGALVSPLDVSTEIPLARQLRRRRRAMIVVGVSLVAAVLLIAAAVANRTPPSVAPIVAASTPSNAPVPAPSAVVAASIAPTPPPPASATSPVATPPSSAAMPAAQPSAAPPRPTARPVQSPKPQKPDDELEYVLPR